MIDKMTLIKMNIHPIKNMINKIQHVDINSLDTTGFVKQHEFDQAFRKL